MSGDADKRGGPELARGQEGGWLWERQRAEEGRSGLGRD